MKLSQIQAFVAVAARKNFSEAALDLNLSQPAISHAIATLEEELGVPLFARGRHGAVLTPAGDRILYHARTILKHLEMMQTEANSQRGLHGGQVRIASFRSVATHILPKVIFKFNHKFPDVTVTPIERTSYVDVEHCLRQGKAEIGITYLPSGEEFETFELMRDEYVALLPPNTKLPQQQLTWQDLASYSIVWLPGLPCGRRLHEHLKTVAPSLPIAYDIQEDSTIVSMVKQGLGAAILARLAAEPIPEEIQVYSLPISLDRVIGVATLTDTLHIPAVFAFLELLKQLDFQTLINNGLENFGTNESQFRRSP
ncbi:MAG: LysR family transcriptional regulator [Xenococcaceae cyanobacterium]